MNVASKYEKRDVKVASKQERVTRMINQLDKIALAAKKKGGSLNENIRLTSDGLEFTRGALKEFDTPEQDLYGYLHYGLMKTSHFLDKLPKEGKGKQKYLYRLGGIIK